MASRPQSTDFKAGPGIEASMGANLIDDAAFTDIDKAAERRFIWKLDLIVLPLLGIYISQLTMKS